MNPRGTFGVTMARRVVYGRSNGVCERCGLRRAVHWHHRLNRSQGGTWHPSNGLHLCLGCHKLMDDSDAVLFDRGWRIKGSDDRTYPEIPVLHWQWGWVTLDDHGDYHLVPAPGLSAPCACGALCELDDMWSTPDDGVECLDCHTKRNAELALEVNP